MIGPEVQRLASRVLQKIQTLEHVECSVCLYDPSEQSEETFCKHVEDTVDAQYAAFDGARRPDHYMQLVEDADDSVDSCCATCLERSARQKKMNLISKAAAETVLAGRDNTEDRFKVVIVPGKQIVNHQSLSFDDYGFTVFLPGKVRRCPRFDDTGEGIRLLLFKDYLSDDPRDKQCCGCEASIDKMSHTRCTRCMSWLCSTCMSERPLLNGTWDICCPSCDKKKDLLDAMNELAWHEKNRWANIWRAMDQVMLRKKVDRIPITIMDEDGSCFHTIASTAAKKMSAKKKRRDITFIGKNIPTDEQLSSKDSVFVLGDMPDVSKGSDAVRKCMKQGVVLSNTDSGYVIEVRDLFAPYSVLVSRDKGVAVAKDSDGIFSDSDEDYDSDCDVPTEPACFSGHTHERAVEVGHVVRRT